MPLLAVPIGLLIGLALGALGGGGSILTVPALVYVLGQDPHTATTSSLLIVGSTSLIALVPHTRAGRVRFGQGLVFGLLGVAGSFAGSILARRVPPDLLLLAFAVLILIVAALMLSRTRPGQNASAPDQERSASAFSLRPLRCDCRKVARILAAASMVGLLTGFFGVGGGFVLVPALVLVLGYSMPTAVGTSLLIIAINSLTALIFRTGGGWDLDWSVIGLFTAAAMAGSVLGSRIADRVSSRRLTAAFAFLLIAVGLYTAARSIIALAT